MVFCEILFCLSLTIMLLNRGVLGYQVLKIKWYTEVIKLIINLCSQDFWDQSNHYHYFSLKFST